MKRLRISFGILCLIVTIAVIVAVCIQWHKQGCEWISMASAILFYSTCALGIWFTIDKYFAGIQRHNEEDEYYGKEED